MKDVIYEVYSNEEFNSVLDYLRANGIKFRTSCYNDYDTFCISNRYYVGVINNTLRYNSTNCYPNTPLIKGFKMTQTPNNTPRTFAITGSKSLLKAVEEELVGAGYKSSETYSFITGTDEGGILGSRYSKANNKVQFELISANGCVEGDVTFQLPQQWDECLAFCKEQLELWDKPKFKVGDKVIVTKASLNSYWYADKIGEVFTLKRSTDDGDGLEWEIGLAGHYLNESDIRLATKEEIEKAQKIEAGGHTMEVVNGKFKFGCQYITKEEVETLRKFVGSPLNFKMKVGDTEVNTELLNKILGKL